MKIRLTEAGFIKTHDLSCGSTLDVGHHCLIIDNALPFSIQRPGHVGSDAHVCLRMLLCPQLAILEEEASRSQKTQDQNIPR